MEPFAQKNEVPSTQFSLSYDQHKKQLKCQQASQQNSQVFLRTEDKNSKKCDICLENTVTEKDQLITCDLCKFSTHQSCYMSDIDNNVVKQWFCQKCWFIIYNDLESKNIKCHFCTEQKGIIKKIKNGKDLWAHLGCVNWIPEIFYDKKK